MIAATKSLPVAELERKLDLHWQRFVLDPRPQREPAIPCCGGQASSIQLESDYADSTAWVDAMTSTRPSSSFSRSPTIVAERRNLRRLSGLSLSSPVDPEPASDHQDAQAPTITDEISEIKRYEDFTTIDWVQDAVNEQNARRAKRRSGGGFWDQEGVFGWRRKVRESYDAGQAWLVVTLVGVAIGLNSAVLNIITEWLSDVKLGYCTTAFYLNEQFCCWGAEGGTSSISIIAYRGRD